MTSLKGTTGFYDYEVSDILAHNIKERLQYGLIGLGAFTNVSSSGDFGTLKRTSSRVYEGIGGGWIWESGINSVYGTSPRPVSGIYVNNTWVPNGSLASGASWYTDYRNGRVVFSSGLPSDYTVKTNYSARDVAVYLSDSSEFKTIMTEFERRYASLDTLQPSGMAGYLQANRVWMPSVFITVAKTGAEGYQLGGGELQEFNVLFHIFSDKPFAAKRLCDIIENQYQTSIDLYNPNDAPFALNFNGSLAASAIQYNSLGERSSPYFWAFSRVVEVGGAGTYSSDLAVDLYRGEPNWIVEVERPIGTY